MSVDGLVYRWNTWRWLRSQTKTQLEELAFLRATYEKCFRIDGEWLQADWALEYTFLAICNETDKKIGVPLLFGNDKNVCPAITTKQAEVQGCAVGKFDACVNDSLRILTRGISALCGQYLKPLNENADYADAPVSLVMLTLDHWVRRGCRYVSSSASNLLACIDAWRRFCGLVAVGNAQNSASSFGEKGGRIRITFTDLKMLFDLLHERVEQLVDEARLLDCFDALAHTTLCMVDPLLQFVASLVSDEPVPVALCVALIGIDNAEARKFVTRSAFGQLLSGSTTGLASTASCGNVPVKFAADDSTTKRLNVRATNSSVLSTTSTNSSNRDMFEHNLRALCNVTPKDVELAVNSSERLPVGVCAAILNHPTHLAKSLALLKQLQTLVRMHELCSQCRIVLAQLGEIFLLAHKQTRDMLSAVVTMCKILAQSLVAQLATVRYEHERIVLRDAATTRGDSRQFGSLKSNFVIVDERSRELTKMCATLEDICRKADSSFKFESFAARQSDAASRVSNLACSLLTTITSHPDLLPVDTVRATAINAADQVRLVALNTIQQLSSPNILNNSISTRKIAQSMPDA